MCPFHISESIFWWQVHFNSNIPRLSFLYFWWSWTGTLISMNDWSVIYWWKLIGIDSSRWPNSVLMHDGSTQVDESREGICLGHGRQRPKRGWKDKPGSETRVPVVQKSQARYDTARFDLFISMYTVHDIGRYSLKVTKLKTANFSHPV